MQRWLHVQLAQSQCVACESAFDPIIIVSVVGLIMLVITVLRWRGVSMRRFGVAFVSLLNTLIRHFKVRGRFDGLRLSRHKLFFL